MASKNLPNSTLMFVPGASHAAFALDDCTRGIAHAFLAEPARGPDLARLQRLPAVVFPADGLVEFLKSMES